MPNELIEREARTQLMDELYRHAVEMHNLATNPIFLIPKYIQIKTELESIEARLMSIQSDLGMLPFE